MYKILVRIDCDFATTSPQAGKLQFLDDAFSMTYLGASKIYYYSQIKSVRIEKFLFWNFCITIDLKPDKTKRNVVSFSSYGHTDEIYKKLCEQIKY